MFSVLHAKTLRIPRRQEEWPEGATGIRTNVLGIDILWHLSEKGGHHMSKEQLEPYRLIGDEKCDNILTLLEQEGTPLGASDDLLKMAQQAASLEEPKRSDGQQEMASFLQSLMSLPSWVDVNQLHRGQQVFLAYAPTILLSLFYMSLVGGFSVPVIGAVVDTTRYMTPPAQPTQTMQRLFDTMELTTACQAIGVEALLPNGIGWQIALYVRILHAKVRHRLLHRKESQQKWDIAAYGIPINQEDMAATLLGFSVNVLGGIELVGGRPLPDQERRDYLALWRYIGWLLGVETAGGEMSEYQTSGSAPNGLRPLDPCGPGYGTVPDSVRYSNDLLWSIVFHTMIPNQRSREIASHLLHLPYSREDTKQNTDGKPKSSWITPSGWFFFQSILCRRFLGDALADQLGLARNYHCRFRGFFIQTAATFCLLYLRVQVLSVMWVPLLKQRAILHNTKKFTNSHDIWLKVHKSKMARAVYEKQPGRLVKMEQMEVDALEKKMGKSTIQSMCPFSMVAHPE
jgi:ER-bound oxygenase mpaB/B'/Rubber oxygenase, catalytic domain